MTPQAKAKSALYRVCTVTAFIVLSPLWVPLIVIWLVAFTVASACIYLAVWLLWLPRSKDILFVYSDSPTWHDYIEQNILPVIRDRAVILNWSQRRTQSWRRSLAVAAFKHFGGYRDFNPMGIVFRPFHFAKVFRFHPTFRDYKHGKPEKLLAMQQEFFKYSSANEIRPNT